MVDDGSQTTENDRNTSGSMGVIGAAAIGIGGMVGGGIFAVLGTAATIAGGGTPLAFFIAGVIALLTAYSYARLSVALPGSGGTIVFIDKAFGTDPTTGTLNAILWLSYLVTIALYASAFGSYGLTFFDGGESSGGSELTRHLLISLAILVPAVINVLDSTIVSRSETAIVVIKLVLLAVVIAAGATSVDPGRLAPSDWPGPGALVLGGMTIFVAYEGFELIANAAEDVRNPSKTLPRAYFSCVGFVVVLYILVAIVTVGSLTPAAIKDASEYALAAAAEPTLGQAGFIVVSISALLATFSAINATIYGNARLGFALAKDGELPDLFERQVWSRPLYGVALTAVLSGLLANLVDLEAIATVASAGFLLVFTATNAAAFKLGTAVGANRLITGTAALTTGGALIALLWNTARDALGTVWLFAGIVVAAGLFEWIYARLSGRHFDKLA